MERTSEYKTGFAPGEADFRERIHPKKDFSLEDTDFFPQPYYQVFQERLGFLPNLSIIDYAVQYGTGKLIDIATKQFICSFHSITYTNYIILDISQ